MIDMATASLLILVLLLVNSGGVVMVAMQLPGTWVILLATAGYAWWRSGTGGDSGVGWWVLGGLLGLAVLGEIVEFAAGAMGSSRAGGTKRAAALAIVGGIVGAVVGTIFLAFIPILGTLIGAAIGAGLGSTLGELWAGKAVGPSLRTGRGAAVGRFWGAVGKLAVAVVMWGLAAAAVLWF